MKDLKEFSIPFTGLALGKHQFDFQVGDEFIAFLDRWNIEILMFGWRWK